LSSRVPDRSIAFENTMVALLEHGFELLVGPVFKNEFWGDVPLAKD